MQFSELLGIISNSIWDIFLPLLVISSLLIWPKMIFKTRHKISKKESVTAKQIFGPIAISLGSMVGTGAVIGVIGVINKLPANVSPEAIAIWSVVGALIMIPLSYSSVLISKTMQMPPRDYISKLISPLVALIYTFAFIALYVFGFGGFQFSGIADVVNSISTQVFEVTFSPSHLFIIAVIPIFLFVAAIVISKKHNLFINAIGSMIGIAVGLYIIFLLVFAGATADHLSIYANNLANEFLHPTNAALGLPVGLLFGVQRIIQASETGLGSIPMAAMDADTKPRPAALFAIFPPLITITIAIAGTTYVSSVGLDSGIMTLGEVSIASYFQTIEHFLGLGWVFIVGLFIILTGITTLVGSYYFIDILLDINVNIKIAIWLSLILLAGTLAIFGFAIIFDAIDMLMFIVSGINVVAILIFMYKDWKQYEIK